MCPFTKGRAETHSENLFIRYDEDVPVVSKEYTTDVHTHSHFPNPSQAHFNHEGDFNFLTTNLQSYFLWIQQTLPVLTTPGPLL